MHHLFVSSGLYAFICEKCTERGLILFSLMVWLLYEVIQRLREIRNKNSEE